MTRILVTGANGFVGRWLCAGLVQQSCHVVGLVRRQEVVAELPSGVLAAMGPEITGSAEWNGTNLDVEVVVHLAARDDSVGSVQRVQGGASFVETNTKGTRCLAEACAAAGVRRFVFLSSIKAVGEGAPRDYRETDLCEPTTEYGVSKRRAEVELKEIGTRTGMEVVVLRPPLIYGPGVGKSFSRLVHIIRRGYPLPCGLVRANARSMVYIDNLVSALARCVRHPAAANETFHVADNTALSTAALVRTIAQSLGRPSRLVPLPGPLLKTIGTLTGRRRELDSLLESLRVSNAKICRRLEWAPPVDVQEGLRRTVEWFRAGCTAPWPLPDHSLPKDAWAA